MTNNIRSIFDNFDVKATDELLNNITEFEVPFGLKNRISRRVYKKTRIRGKTSRPLWLIPATALIALVVTIAAIPDARAAVADFFNSMFSAPRYIAEDKEERPVVSAIEKIIQTPVPALSGSADVAQSFTFSAVSDDAQFLNNVSAKVDEVLYDGEQIIISANLTGEIAGFGDTKYMTRDYMFIPSDIIFTGEDGTINQFRCGANFFTPTDYIQLNDNSSGNAQETLDKLKLIISAGDEKISLSGMQQVTLTLKLLKGLSVDKQKDGRMKPIGDCTLSFSFDATAGHNSLKTLKPDKTIALTGEAPITESIQRSDYIKIKNTMLPLDGCAVKLERISYKPTGVSIRLLYKCADSWSDSQKAAFLGGIGYGLDFDTIINGKNYGGFGYSYGDYDGTWSYVKIQIPITGDEQAYIQSLEILPLVNYITEVNGVAVTSQQQKISINSNGEEGGWSQEQGKTYLDDCKLTVDLP